MTHWKRVIALIDMNSFFAAIEQRDHPELRGQPIGITNGEQGRCIITSSYEARAYGIKTGMRLEEAQAKCPHFMAVPSRPHVYADTSAAIMEALHRVTPLVEVFSIDEAFCDLTACQRLLGTPEQIGRLIKQTVFEVSGLLCSIGVSGDKTTAKWAAKLHKPNGFTVIPPWEAKARLKDVLLTDLCGIAEGIGNFLALRGIYYCGEMEKLPISVLGKRFGNLGRRIWLMAQGLDPDPVNPEIKAAKSMGHGKVIPPGTKDKETHLIYLRHMTEKLAARLRQNGLQAQTYFIGWKSYQAGWLGSQCKLLAPSQDGRLLYQVGCEVFQAIWQGQAFAQIQVTALDPQPENRQLDLFMTPNPKQTALHQAIDNINRKYGEFTIAPAPLLKRTKMHNVIAPGWRPVGHRRSV